MSKVLLLGYFGAGNLGDDGLLADWLVRFGPRLRQAGATADVAYNGGDTLGGFAEEGMIRPLVSALISKKQLLRLNPRDYSALIAPGGSLLQDATSLRSLLFYLWAIRRFARAGVPVYLLNQGIGPLRSPISRYLVPQVLRLTRMLSLRDQRSFDWAKAQLALGAHREIHLSADPLLAGWLLPAHCPYASPGHIVLVPKASRKPRGKPEDARLVTSLVEFVARLRQVSGAEPVILPLQPGADAELARSVSTNSGAQHPPSSVPQDMLELISNSSMTVSYRLHGLILSAACGVPALGVSYDPKVSAFCEGAGLPYVSPADVLSGAAIEAALKLWQNRQAVTERMLELRGGLLQRLASSEARFEQLWSSL